MSHSWAVTFNASQGATKKNTIGIIENHCVHEDIYTVFTRSTHTLKIFAESKESLEKSLLKSKSNLTATEIVKENKEKFYIQKSNKMDFYDKYQKNLNLADDGKSFTLSFAAPSDLSAYYFTADSDIKNKILELHELAIKETLEKFMKYNRVEGEYKYNSKTFDTIFDNVYNLSKIQYIHSNLKFTKFISKDGIEKELNRFSFIENQKIIKNFYETILSDHLSKYLNLSVFNEAGIIRIHEKNNHVHALFAEHFEKNILKLECDKFSSPHELKEKISLYGLTSYKLNKNKDNQKTIHFDKIVKDIPNEKLELVSKLSEDEIIKNALYNASKDLQIFDETILFQSLLQEAKGSVSLEKSEELFGKLLVHEDLRFLNYDRFGKMLFCYKDLSNEEANILKNSALRKTEKESILSFDRVVRRIEKEKLNQNQTAGLLHFTCDEGGVKFLSKMNNDDTKVVIKNTEQLYSQSGYKVLKAYAGRIYGFSSNEASDLHVRSLVESIEQKRTQLNKDTVIILKDLGKNISSTSSKLFEMAEKSGAKIICVANDEDFVGKERIRFLKDLNRTSGVHLGACYRFCRRNKLSKTYL